MREVVFDTETTGREAEGGDRIVEIGCVELIKLAPTGSTLQRYINPAGRDIPDEVVRVHGLTNAFLSNKPLFKDPDVVDALMAFLGDSPIVAHNAEFDRRFLNAELVRLGREPLPSERFVDTLVIARKKYPGASNSLDALSRRFQLDKAGFDLGDRKGPGGHGALKDARMLAEVYLELRGGREQKLALEEEGEAGAADSEGVRLEAIVRRERRPKPLQGRLTPAEREVHAGFVAKLGAEALWKKWPAE
ncbi:MAG: DNA polymerase III subunit epsilon [Caulobacterales bacterium]|jgi:DNA polymerase-3 subunit epsilon